MPKPERQPGEPLEVLLRRFRRELTQSGQLSDFRRKQHHLSKGELRREKMRKSARRMRRRSGRSSREGRREY